MVQIWAATKSKGKMPPLDRYLVKADAEPETPQGKVRRHFAAVQVLSAQFGIPIRRATKS